MAAFPPHGDHIEIASLTEADWPSVRRIFDEGIATGNATFETAAPEWPEWDSRYHVSPRLVARFQGQVIGWAAISPVSRRAAYRGVAEVSVYVDQRFRRHKLGRRLLAALIAESEAAGIWTLQATIFPENEASLRLFESLGFRRVGVRERIGQMAGRWRDTVLMERRSPSVGY